MPRGLAEQVLAVSRDAYVHGLHVAALAGAAVLLGRPPSRLLISPRPTASEPGLKATTLMSMEISTTRTEHPVDDARLAEILANPGFGIHFTDHMFTVEWTPADGWHDARVTPYGPLTLDPATAVLHYAQEIFEGMKAYRHEDGSIWAFRPEENAARMVRSTHRLALPPLDVDDFVQAVEALVEVDQRWVPDHGRGRRASTSGRSCSPPSRSSASGPPST